MLAHSLAHGLRARRVNAAHMGQCGRHAAGLQVLRGRGLGKGAGVGVAELFAHGRLGQQRARRNHPAHTQAGAQYLAEAAAMRQQLAAARHRLAQRQQAGRRRFAEVQITIRVVLDDQGLVLHRQFQHAAAALGAQHGATGVAKGRDQVDELGSVLGDQRFQAVHLHAVAVDRRADQIGAVQAEALDRREKGRTFDDHLVARVDQRLAQQVQRLLAAGGDDQLLGRQIGHALARHERGQLLAQGVVALGRTVLQRRARLFSQGLIDRGLYALDVKHRAVGETAGEADDAGLAQQLEQFTDGRGFNQVQAVGKFNGHGGYLSMKSD